ncbi:serine hydrolase domain-containing protein [Frateuria sp. GZRR35]|uniref:serine hydrolase domain-containing protein n=1 Tax=unclassified Frateuria TaxID=2648894 RepID=UPI003EDC6BCC
MQLRTLPLLIAGLLGAATIPALARAATPASPSATASPADSGTQSLPPARVQATLEAYKQWLGKLDQRDAVAGLATAVVVNDKVVFEGTIGYADAADKEPVKPDTVFRLASLSKAFATGLAAILVQDGKLAWDTRLVNVLPFFKLKNVPDTQRATVADILGQRLGLPRNTYDNMLEDDVPYEELVRKLDQVDMTCGVGKCYGYQNVAFSLIGDVVYAMTGNFFYKLVDRRIFLPLGMTTASYGRAGLESSKSWARPHRRTRRGWVPFEPKENYYRVAPAAGVNASLRDMEKWLIAQMGGRPDVLSPATLEALHTPGVRTPGELHSSPWRNGRLTSAAYALGWRVFTYGGETLVYHAGAVEGYRTMIGFFPKYHTGVVTMWNAGVPTPSGLMPMVFDSLLGLPHVDWAGLEKSVTDRPRTRTRARRHRRH